MSFSGKKLEKPLSKFQSDVQWVHQSTISDHYRWLTIGSCSRRARNGVFKVNHNKFCDIRRLFISAKALGNLLSRLCSTFACVLSSLPFPICTWFSGRPITFELDLAKATFDRCPIFPLFIFSALGFLWRSTFIFRAWCCGRKSQQGNGANMTRWFLIR